MIHGGLAYVDSEQIRLSEDLLRPLSIAAGSTVFGYYYPPPPRPGYERAPVKHDFMFTPVPYESWPISAALIVHIEHAPGSYARVSRYLADKQVNIICAQCTRSGHRHATWFLIVEFLWLRDEELVVHQLDELAGQLQAQVATTVQELTADCEDSLLKQNSPYLREPVSGWPLRALAYFYRESLGSSQNTRRLLKATCRGRSTLELQWSPGLEQYPELGRELPTLGFASLDTQSFNLRLAVPDRSDLKRFRTMSIDYAVERREWQDSSLGLMSSLSDALKENWNLWRAFNQTRVNVAQQETGTVRLFMQRLSTDSVDSEAENANLRQLVRDAIPQKRNFTLKRVSIAGISPRKIFISLKNSDDFSRRQEVLTACSDLASKIGVLRDYVISVETFAAESLVAEASNKIADSSGMLQVYMADDPSLDTTWLNSEFFLAAHLGKPCVRIVAESMKDKVAFLRDRQPLVIEDDISPQELRKKIEFALRELDEHMEDRRLRQ